MAEARSAVHEPHVGRIEEGRSAQHDFYVGLRASIIRRFFRTRCVHNQSTETAERTVTALSFFIIFFIFTKETCYCAMLGRFTSVSPRPKKGTVKFQGKGTLSMKQQPEAEQA